MSKNIKTQIGTIIGETLNSYHSRVKPTIDDLKYRQEYQNRIIECMVGEVDDNYITTPETDSPIVKLEYSKEGLVKVPTVKGKTILVDSEGNETDTPAEGCKLLSVGEQENNKMIILSKNNNLFDKQNWTLKPNNSNLIYTDEGVKLTCNIDNPYWASYLVYEFKLQPNTTYRLSGIIKKNDGFSDATVALEVHNREGYITRVSTKQNTDYSFVTIKLTTSSDGYLKIQFHPCHGTASQRRYDVEFKNLQLELGEINTAYTQNKQHKVEILLDEPLRGLSNGVCDEIVGNQLIRRVGTVHTKTNPPRFVNFHWYHENINEVRIAIPNALPVNCGATGSIFTNSKYSRWDTFNLGHIYIYMTKEQYGDLPLDNNGATKWVQDNPCEIYYKLAEPIIEELPSSITLQGFDDTTMYIENSITPTISYGYNALIPYKQELLNQQEEVEVNTLDIENNIIPYLMDMEFNLIMMGDEE